MTLVAGVDSSTQSCKVSVRDLATGASIREGRASHPRATIVDPEVWWEALLAAVRDAGGLEDVSAISVSGQQHTPVFLDASGGTASPSPLWNDTGSHRQMVDLNRELGREEWIRRTGLPLTLSDTVTKVRWLRDTDPDGARRTSAVAVVHDWLTWRLRGYGPGTGGIDHLTTDRSEASGTGYWSGETNHYCMDLFEHAFRGRPCCPEFCIRSIAPDIRPPGSPAFPRGSPSGSAVATMPPRRSRSMSGRATRSSPSGPPEWSTHARRGRCTTTRASSAAMPMRTGSTFRSPRRSTQRATSSSVPRSSAARMRSSPTLLCRRRRAPTASRCCRTSKVNGPQTCRTCEARSMAPR